MAQLFFNFSARGFAWRMARTIAAAVPIVAVAAAVAVSPRVANAQQDNDLVILDPSQDPAQRSGGRLTAQTVDTVRYEQAGSGRDAARVTNLTPWTIRYVRYGYRGLDEAWSTSLFNLQSGSYAEAANGFDRFIKNNLANAGGSREQRAVIQFATYYYLGRSYLGLAQQIDRIGQRHLTEIQQVLALDLNERLSRERDQAWTPQQLNDVREDALRAVRRVLADVGQAGNERLAGDLISEIQSARTPSALATAIREKFRPFYMQFSKPQYELARDALIEPFKTDAFQQHKLFWFFEMKLATARVYLGLGEYGMALSEINEASEAVQLEGGGTMAVPRRDREKNPSLLVVARQFANNQPGYWHLICRGLFLAAEIYETAGDFYNARSAYDEIVRNAPRTEEFARYRNDANLEYGIALAKGRGASYSLAERHLRQLIGEFTRLNDSDFDPAFLFDNDQASLFAGAYLGLGEIAYGEFKRRRDAQFRQTALENFLRVTAMFSADADKRAKALYWASKIYREIAQDEWGQFAPKDPTWKDGERTVHNPYHYYISVADKLRTELRENYGNTRWATAD